ncbi:TetR/AcrR family transcriptional regulator [Phenylobacterium sp.]|uniref:TetR/AcrR family transcriptional regulator n=1 Tax=Phenylobacterium sp. TaxID=1871053 RepID=UPI00301C3EF4
MPSNASPRTKPADVRRREILAAAEAVVREKGVGGFSVSDVTQRAAIAKGSFYLHFESKDAVVAALRERFVEDILSEVATRVDTCAPDDWDGQLDAWVRHGLALCLSPRNLALNEILFHGGGAPGLREDLTSHGRGVAHLRDLIARGATAGAWSASDPKLVAVFLYSALHGVLDHAAVSGEDDPERLASALIRLCRRVLKRD